MRLFLFGAVIVSILTGVSGYYSYTIHKKPKPSYTHIYPSGTTMVFERIESLIKESKLEAAMALCDEVILSSNDKSVVAKGYFLRSKVYHAQHNLDKAKADLLYAKEIDYETFSKHVTFSFAPNLREFALYESELFSGWRQSYVSELRASIYYVLSLSIALFFVFIAKLFTSLNRTKLSPHQGCSL